MAIGLAQHLHRRIGSDDVGVQATCKSFGKAARSTSEIQHPSNAMDIDVRGNGVHPELKEIRAVIARLVVGPCNFCLVVVHND